MFEAASEAVFIGEMPTESSERAGSYDFVDTTRNSRFYRGGETTGWTFGRGGDFSVRIYDKTAELGFRRRTAQGLRGAMMADEKRAHEAEIWTRNGWQEGEPVTRIEVQVRGTALAEICDRCETKVADVDPDDYEQAVDEACAAMCAAFEKSIDEIWQYATQKWLRHIEPRRTRRCRCVATEWWTEVQAVRFVSAGEAAWTRVRRRSAVRSAQALGSVLSLIALHGHHSPWVDTRGPVWTLPDEERVAHHLEAVGMAKARLVDEIQRAFELAAPIVTRDLLEHAGSTRAALERLIVRWSAATARFQPGEQARFAERYRPEPAKNLRVA